MDVDCDIARGCQSAAYSLRHTTHNSLTADGHLFASVDDDVSPDAGIGRDAMINSRTRQQ